jgi:hypothetical protein
MALRLSRGGRLLIRAAVPSAILSAIPSAIPSAIYGQAVLTGRPADAARVQLAKAGLVNALGNTPGSLDALIAQIADAR